MVPKLFVFSKIFGFCIFNIGKCPCIVYKNKIYFFEVNTKYISSSELKTSKFSRVRSENFDVFNSLDEIYLVFTSKK